MRIVVVGAGEVGYDVSAMLSSEGHDVVVVERDESRAASVRDKLDVMVIHGNGASSASLRAAGIQRADIMIAVTTVDEVNIIACMMADRLGVETTIARIRSGEYTETDSVLSAQDFGIDFVIHPEESTAEEAARLIRRTGATDALAFADGRLQLLGIRVESTSPVVSRKLIDIARENSDLHFRIMAVKRGGRTIVPRGDEVIRQEDQVFVLSISDDTTSVSRLFTGRADRGIDHLMILGGGLVGARLAHTLSRGKKKIKLIEADRERARVLAEGLENVLVLHGDPTDIDLLAAEGLAEMDALAAVTPDEESNLVACLMAKHLGVRKTVALLSKRAYIPISQAIGLDAAINVKLAVTAEVSRFLRGKHVLSVGAIHGVDAEILELLAREESSITRKPISKLSVPHGALIGAVIGEDGVRIATGSTVVKPGESAIIFSLPNVTSKLEKLFDAR